MDLNTVDEIKGSEFIWQLKGSLAIKSLRTPDILHTDYIKEIIIDSYIL